MIKIVIDDTQATEEEHKKLCQGIRRMNEGDYIKEFIEQEGVEVYIQNHGSVARLKKRAGRLSSLFNMFTRKRKGSKNV